jgi:heat-inducible transcriptional repressor
MKNSGLREKDRLVLQTIVEDYLKSGQPVSSGVIHQKRILEDSPATLRNIMAKLEELGFLAQPHASAGRVPTDRGLRYYVNCLLAEEPRIVDLSGPLDRGRPASKDDLNALLQEASRHLAEQSDSVGFVLSPRISRINFHHLRFIKIAEAKVMLLLVTTFNMVLTEIVATDSDFTQTELDRASQYINQKFAGKNLAVIRDSLLHELPVTKSQFDQAFARLMALLRASILQEENEMQMIVQGAAQLIDKFEEGGLDKLKLLFQNFEEKAHLARLLSDFIALDKVKVVIGEESRLPLISECSLVLSHYGDDRQVLGTLGIIGPKRIPYKKIIPLVDNVAKRLSRTISRNPS